MTTARDLQGKLRHAAGAAGTLDIPGRFAKDLTLEPGNPLANRKTVTVDASDATLNARSEMQHAEAEHATRSEILERDEERLARARISLAVKQLATDGPAITRFELFFPETDPTFNGGPATAEQLEPLRELADAIRSDETLIEHLGTRGEVTVDGATVTVNINLIADGLANTQTLERLARNRYWAETAYNTQWHETQTTVNRLAETSALFLASEITDRHPTADALIASEDGSNLIVADKRGTVLGELPGSDAALFFSQHISGSVYRLLPPPADDHPAITAGFPRSVVFSIPSIREINEHHFS